jgi:hypothetical protein
VSDPDPGQDELERTAELVETEFPGLHVRFARVMGRRVSHIAGSASRLPGEQFSVDLAPGLVAILSGSTQECLAGAVDRMRSILGLQDPS